MTTILTNDGKYEPYEYKNEDELEKIVIEHAKEIFGENCLFFPKKLIQNKFNTKTIPDGFLVDVKNKKFYIVEVERNEHDFYGHIHPQISKFRSSFKEEKTKREITEFIYAELNDENKEKIKNFAKNNDSYKFLHDIVFDSYGIIIVIDHKDEQIEEELKDSFDNVKIIELKTYKKINSTSLDGHIHAFSPFYDSSSPVEDVNIKSLEDFIEIQDLDDEDKKIISELIERIKNIDNNVRIDFSTERISCKIGVKRFAAILHSKIHKRDIIDKNDRIEVFIFPVNEDSQQWVKDTLPEWSKYESIWTRHFTISSFEDIDYALSLIKQSYDELIKRNSIELSSEMKCKKCGRISFKGEYCAVCRRLGYDKGRTTETKSKFFKKV